MKKKIFQTMVILFIPLMSAMAADSLKVTVVTTTPASGSYAPEYVLAFWIESATNVFQRTFRRVGNETNTNDLPIWRSKCGSSTTIDGLTSATLNTRSTVRGTWNLNGVGGTKVPYGTYKYRVEMSSAHNSSAVVGGTILIDGTAKTVAVIDTTLGALASTARNLMTSLTAEFVPGATSALPVAEVNRAQSDPLTFRVPAGFSGKAFVRLLAPDGKQLWSGTYAVIGGGTFRAAGIGTARLPYSGVCFLVIDFGSTQVVRSYAMTR